MENIPVNSSWLLHTTVNDRQRAVGFAVGAENDGLSEGVLDGPVVGSTLGDPVGTSVVGARLGLFEGAALGLTVGDEKLGALDGESVG